MTNELEKTFFDTFGIEPTHDDACKLADKYWGNEELAEEYYVFERYMEKNCPKGGKECFATCKYAYDNIEYPQITDSIYLELHCLLNSLDSPPYGLTVKEFKKDILISAIGVLSRNETANRIDNIKQQVQALFEEGLKEEIKKHNDDMFKNPPEKRFYCKGCTLPYISKKLKQTLTEIKEIAEKLKNFYEELGKCEDLTVVRLKQILQKISECEGNDGK